MITEGKQSSERLGFRYRYTCGLLGILGNYGATALPTLE